MTVTSDNAIAVDRQVSLLEAFLFAMATHAAILVILSLFGLLSMLTERPAQQPNEDEMSVRFEVAPEPPPEPDRVEPAESAASAETPVPQPEGGEPEPAPAQNEPATPDPDAPAGLDAAQPLVVPTPPVPPPAESIEPPLPSEAGDQADAPSSDGLPEGVDQGEVSELEDGGEPVEPEPGPESSAETTPLDAQGVETELSMPETDDGRFASLEQAGAPESVEPPPPGQPSGPSLDERISDFTRAVQRAREAVPPQTAQQPRNVFEPDWSNLPTTGQALGNLTFESGDYDWEDYGRQIYWIIWRAWHNRLLARVDDFEKWAQQNQSWYLDHINGVRFTIERNGEISGVVVVSDSGSVPFDLSAVEGLEEAVLPPLPGDFPRDSENVHAHFIGQGPINQMRRGLQLYKDRGWF